MQEAELGQKEELSGEAQRYNTHQFGEIEVLPQHIFYFPEGLFGFEHLHKFVLISEEYTEPLKWLLSLEDLTIGFPIVSPFILVEDYKIGKKDQSALEIPFVVVNLPGKNGQMSANLRAPIFLHAEEQLGRQEILASDKYPTDFVIQ